MFHRKQIILISALLILASMSLTACGGANAVSKGFKSKDPNTFVSLEFGNVDTLDPALAYDSVSGGILQNVYDNLVEYKRDLGNGFGSGARHGSSIRRERRHLRRREDLHLQDPDGGEIP